MSISRVIVRASCWRAIKMLQRVLSMMRPSCVVNTVLRTVASWWHSSVQFVYSTRLIHVLSYYYIICFHAMICNRERHSYGILIRTCACYFEWPRLSLSDLGKYLMKGSIARNLSATAELLVLYPYIRPTPPRGTCHDVWYGQTRIVWLRKVKQEVKVIWQKAPHGGPLPG